MSAQSNVENVLKRLHLLLAKSETYPLDEKKVVVEKKKILNLLTELNQGISEIMEEYEVTKQSRANAERQFQRQSEKIIEDAKIKAEDIYAASVMYTDESLSGINEIIYESNKAIANVYAQMSEKLEAQQKLIRENQLEFVSQLQGLRDTEEYLKLIDERKKEKKKEKETEQKEERKATSLYANRMTEIKINEDYFEKMGIALEQEAEKEMEQTLMDAAQAEIKVNLDADYFKWKEERDREPSQKKTQSGKRKFKK